MPDLLPDVWHWIEKRSFAPSGKKQREEWLKHFIRFLPEMWGAGTREWVKKTYSWSSDSNKPFRPSRDDVFGFTYDIEPSIERFSVRLYCCSSSFQIEYDRKYLFEFANYKKIDPPKHIITMNKIKEVLEKRIVHPALHTHLTSADEKNFADNDDIHNHRFGFASCNPFAILYQTAFQLIKSPELKDNEIRRLSSIIYSHRENRFQIGSGILFKM